MTAALSAVSKEGFSITPETSGSTITLKLAGSCDSHTTALLSLFLADLHIEAVRVRAKKVTLDCENLYFMNSSAVKTFVTWLSKIRALSPVEKYQVTVKANRYLAWQARSFGAICRAAPEVIAIDQ
jgi:hypothetical protein